MQEGVGTGVDKVPVKVMLASLNSEQPKTPGSFVDAGRSAFTKCSVAGPISISTGQISCRKFSIIRKCSPGMRCDGVLSGRVEQHASFPMPALSLDQRENR